MAESVKNIKMVKLNEIKPYEKNPRRNDEAVEYVANSIQEFGFKNPILIDKEGTIINGHTRYKAAKKLKLKEVPVMVADDLTEEQVKALRLADNKTGEIAGWDFDLLQGELNEILELNIEDFGFGDLQLYEEEKEIEEIEEVEIPEEPEEKNIYVKQGQIYKLGRHRLMCGDSTSEVDVEKLMNGELADLLVTDPPYNIDYTGTGHKAGTKKPIENDNLGKFFKDFLKKAFKSANLVIKKGGAFYVWYASKEVINFQTALEEEGFNVKQELIWNKNGPNLSRQDYNWKHEPCLYGWKEGAAHYFTDDRTPATVIEDKGIELKKLKKEELIKILEEILSDKQNTTVINENKPTTNDLHPTMKPVKLFARLIKNSSKINEKVLDIFGGSGTTIIACEQLNRTAYTMEYDPKYAQVIIERWESFTGQKAELIEEEE